MGSPWLWLPVRDPQPSQAEWCYQKEINIDSLHYFANTFWPQDWGEAYTLKPSHPLPKAPDTVLVSQRSIACCSSVRHRDPLLENLRVE